MFETLNKRLWPAMAAERRENAQRYWARKTGWPPAKRRAADGAHDAPHRASEEDQNQ